MAAHRLFLLLCLYTTLNQILNVQSSTPFCQLCPCNSKPNDPPNINCISAGIDNIYDSKFWFDDTNNASYPIASLVIKNNNLKVLKTKFPSSGLQILDLSNNSISELGVSIFSQLQNLSELDLGNNDIELIAPDVFKGVYNKEEYYPLKSLKNLNLQHNKLHSLNGDVFEHIDDLHILNLSNNPLLVIDSQTLSAIASLVNLRMLDLSSTQLKTLPDYFMHAPKYLTVLDLSGNKFEYIPKTLAESHSLETLYINNNPISTVAASNVFPQISTLKELHMSHMPLLEEIGAHALSGLEKLERLHLSYNRHLISIQANALVKQEGDKEMWPPLTELFLDHNNISYLDHRTVIWHRLEKLDLGTNPWSCDCMNQWLIDDLMPVSIKINEMQAEELTCKYPIEMENITLYNLSQRNSTLRCLDIYGNRPENDAFILIGVLSGSLTAVFIFMFIMYVYRAKVLHLGPGAGGPVYTRV